MSEGTSISLHQRPFLMNFVQWIVPPVFDQPPHAITFISFVLGEVVSTVPLIASADPLSSEEAPLASGKELSLFTMLAQIFLSSFSDLRLRLYKSYGCLTVFLHGLMSLVSSSRIFSAETCYLSFGLYLPFWSSLRTGMRFLLMNHVITVSLSLILLYTKRGNCQ